MGEPNSLPDIQASSFLERDRKIRPVTASDLITIWDRPADTQPRPHACIRPYGGIGQHTVAHRQQVLRPEADFPCVFLWHQARRNATSRSMTHAANTDISFSAASDGAAPLQILTPPHPVLRQKARLVKPEDVAEIRKILPNMFSAMYQAPGIGLAAPQVGLSQRFILVDLGEKDARDPIVMINPEVIAETEDMAVREEGCLSLPNQYAEVVRPEKIRVRWNNVNGDVVEREAEGLLATCIQHEIDHLEGVLFVDHLSALRRNMILRRLAKELKRK
ncbi:N-formylmethionylaminoacyl-tRNA deformylase [Acetobacter pasteurianus 386B]|nr:N-formylmethionylaminoacyl-tRNA deformylase [Acetobacter pasteurianus 386B]